MASSIVRASIWGALIAAGIGCGGAPKGPLTLTEGYCKNGEGDRCFFDQPVLDGF